MYNGCNVEGKARKPSKAFEGEEAFRGIAVWARQNIRAVHTAKCLEMFKRYATLGCNFFCPCRGWLCAVSIELCGPSNKRTKSGVEWRKEKSLAMCVS